MKSQNEMILEHLRKHKTINLVTAYDEYGVMALHSRISNLRQQGHDILTVYNTKKNRFGRTVRVFHYELIEEAK